MLIDGVTSYQRVSCFRLAVHLKRIGFPFDIAVAALKVWALKNQPQDDKRGDIGKRDFHPDIVQHLRGITRGYGCEDPAIKTLLPKRMSSKNEEKGPVYIDQWISKNNFKNNLSQ